MIPDSQILNALPGLCYWKDIQSRYIGCNKSTLNATGLKSEDAIIGMDDYNLLWAEEASQYQAQDMQTLTGQSLSVIEKIHLKDVRDCFAMTRKNPIYQNGTIVGVFGQAFVLFNPETIKRLTSFYRNDAFLFDGVEIKNYQILDKFPKLTARETDCLFYFLRNYSTKIIAKRLGISPRTVEQHLASVKQKYDCQSRVDLLNFCFNHGLNHIIITTFLEN